MEEDSFNQTFFTFETCLSKELYQNMEKQFQKENSKTFIIMHKNEIISKLHPIVLDDDEYIKVFQLFENNQLILPDHLDPTLINSIIH